MAKRETKVKQVANCIRTILNSKGTSIKIKDVIAMIENENLDDPVALSQKVENGYQEALASKQVDKASERRERIATFVVSHWSDIKDNAPVRDGLLHLYAMGRINKEQRQRLQNELVERCGGGLPTEETQEAGAELLSKEYDF